MTSKMDICNQTGEYFTEYAKELSCICDKFQTLSPEQLLQLGPADWMDLSNCSDDYYYYDYDDSVVDTHWPGRLAAAIVMALICLLGVTGNCLIVITVLRNRAMKTVTNFYLVNLAVSDLLFLIFCVPAAAVLHLNNFWTFGSVMCELKTCFFFLPLVHICSILLDHYVLNRVKGCICY